MAVGRPCTCVEPPWPSDPAVKWGQWRRVYEDLLCTPEEAVAHVRRGDRVGIPVGIEATVLVPALVERAHEVGGLRVTAMGPQQTWESLREGLEAGVIDLCLDMVTGRALPALLEGKVDYAPTLPSLRSKAGEWPRLKTSDLDVVPVVVSEPDEDGYCSFGHTLFNKHSYATAARTVLGEIDPSQIRTRGNNRIHVSEFTALVRRETPVIDFVPARVGTDTPQGRAIGEHIRTLLRDGDVLQIGPGSVLSSLAAYGVFDDLADLGLHAPVLDDGIMPLVKAGHFAGAKKSRHAGIVVTGGIAGASADSLIWATDNPLIEFHDISYTNNVAVIASHDNIVSLNGAIGVDLTGQVAGDSWGGQFFGGAAGQIEFASGVLASPGGRGIIAMKSTTGDRSRIVPSLPPGTNVTVQRSWVDIVVTEYGVAHLQGRSLRERMDALVSIAHPDHVPDLREAAKELL